MNNTLIDNSTDALSMRTYLKHCIGKEGIDHIRIATGYWDVPGMALVADELRAFLEREGTRLQILIGKDPYVYASHLKDQTQKFPDDYIKTDLLRLLIKEEYKLAVDLLLTHCKHTETDDDGQEIEVGTGRIEVNKYTEDKNGEDVFLHSKCYIFMGNKSSFGIIGSSNFTRNGLTQNAELNYLETNGMIITAEPKEGSPSKGHRIWFDEKWEQSTPWTNEFVNEFVKPSPIGREVNRERKQRQKEEEVAATAPFTPYELYIKLLQTQFATFLDTKLSGQIKDYLPTTYSAFDYQIDAVKQCYEYMQRHGGFLLADVVGLGKTVVGALIVRHFLSTPQKDGRGGRVLIITPPAVLQPWRDTIGDICAAAPELNNRIDYISLGRLDKFTEDVNDEGDEERLDDGTLDGVLDQSKTYGLILIDESHRFRNSDTEMYRALNGLIGSIAPTPYVGLLSATPQNNRPQDLKNQIYLFERTPKSSTLTKVPGGDLDAFFKEVHAEYQELIDKNSPMLEDQRTERLKRLSEEIRSKVLVDIMVRRTRTDVEMNYGEDMEAQGLVFPRIEGPTALKYVMDSAQVSLFNDTMRLIAPGEEDKDGLTYARYRAIEYFADPANAEKHKGRGSRTAGDVAGQLAWLMQQSLVKRLESSAGAFRESLHNLWQNTQNMIRMWGNNTLFVCPDIDINGELRAHPTFEQAVAALRRKINDLNKQGRNEGGKNAEYRREDFDEMYIELLQRDERILSDLCARWDPKWIKKDPKLEAFKRQLPALFDTEKNTTGLLVIFTEAIPTAAELGRVVKEAGHRPLVIRSQNREEERVVIRRNFDANCPAAEQLSDYDVLITTDTLAEGVNLHRAHVILNYDTPWNATRLMQRIGRVNRIGSAAPHIYVYNFMPSDEGDERIKLVQKAHVKLQSFHTLFGEDSKIFSNAEDVVHYALLPTSDQIEDEVGDAPYLKYVKELRAYVKTHRPRYRRIEEANAPGDWLMVQTTDDKGTAYFLVGTQPANAMIVYFDPQSKTRSRFKVVSPIDVLEELRADEAACAIDPPMNSEKMWKALEKEALQAYKNHVYDKSSTRVGDALTKARKIIDKLYDMPNLSATAKQILKQATKQVRGGNVDVINRILEIDQKQYARQQQLFSLDDLIEQALGGLAKEVPVTSKGDPRIILGTIK